MPHVESLEALVSHVMTEQTEKHGRPLYDVSRARFYGVCGREMYLRPPEELHRPGLLAKLNKTMYGTQDASNVLQKTLGDHLQANGFALGSSGPSLSCSDFCQRPKANQKLTSHM
eukprot:1730811-Amphidinium_carterae.1